MKSLIQNGTIANTRLDLLRLNLDSVTVQAMYQSLLEDIKAPSFKVPTQIGQHLGFGIYCATPSGIPIQLRFSSALVLISKFDSTFTLSAKEPGFRSMFLSNIPLAFFPNDLMRVRIGGLWFDMERTKTNTHTKRKAESEQLGSLLSLLWMEAIVEWTVLPERLFFQWPWEYCR